jgi:DHA1 family multidrug resistance protein-like MFS transporter
METFRDATFGKLLRLLSGKWCLPYPEESDSLVWTQHPQVNQDDQAESATADGRDPSVSAPSGVEPRKSRIVVGWRGPDDSEVGNWHGTLMVTLTWQQNPQNWSNGKKLFVSSLIWLLTFSIYIGSAIYTAGIGSVSVQFGVSRVAATLGLTLFVLGYGVGSFPQSLMSTI